MEDLGVALLQETSSLPVSASFAKAKQENLQYLGPGMIGASKNRPRQFLAIGIWYSNLWGIITYPILEAGVLCFGGWYRFNHV